MPFAESGRAHTSETSSRTRAALGVACVRRVCKRWALGSFVALTPHTRAGRNESATGQRHGSRRRARTDGRHALDRGSHEAGCATCSRRDRRWRTARASTGVQAVTTSGLLQGTHCYDSFANRMNIVRDELSFATVLEQGLPARRHHPWSMIPATRPGNRRTDDQS